MGHCLFSFIMSYLSVFKRIVKIALFGSFTLIVMAINGLKLPKFKIILRALVAHFFHKI